MCGNDVESDDDLRQVILDYWLNARSKQLDPGNMDFVAVDDYNLESRISKYATLSDICEICQHGFFKNFRNDEYQITLYDSDMVLLKQLGNKSFINELNQKGIVPGVINSKDTFGITAEILAMDKRRPALVSGPEHYLEAFHDTLAYAVPLRKDQGDLIGIFSLVYRYGFYSHDKILDFVSAIGKIIEYAYDWRKNKDQHPPLSVIDRNKKDIPEGKKLYSFEDIVGNSISMRESINLARQATSLPFNVLIKGESGTGKEVFAQAIHYERCGDRHPLVYINCAAVPSELIESELFGYAEGAFTGALKGGKIGLFEAAGEGTIFLDEINSMSLNMQAKLLHALQNKAFTKIGSTKEIQIKAHFISASNSDLIKEIAAGRFRKDLYYRLNVIDIYLPPLRKRKSDIPVFTHNSLQKLNEDFQLFIDIDESAMEHLLYYDWPGNVRELEHVIEKAVVSTISKDRNKILLSDIEYLHNGKNMVLVENIQESQPPSLGRLADVEKSVIIETLIKHKHNKTKTASELGITRKTLYRKLQAMDISSESIYNHLLAGKDKE